jgi:hypothetical protein
VTQGKLGQGQMLAVDSTTMPRTLEIMSRDGWVARRHGKAGASPGYN